MTFGELKNFQRFTVEGEPESLFYKEGNNFDGSINAYQIKNKRHEVMLKPVTFSKYYDVFPTESTESA